jgi:hypothetical protein
MQMEKEHSQEAKMPRKVEDIFLRLWKMSLFVCETRSQVSGSSRYFVWLSQKPYRFWFIICLALLVVSNSDSEVYWLCGCDYRFGNDLEMFLNESYQGIFSWMFSLFPWNTGIHWCQELSAIYRAYWVQSQIFCNQIRWDCREICWLSIFQFNILNGSV